MAFKTIAMEYIYHEITLYYSTNVISYIIILCVMKLYSIKIMVEKKSILI